MRQFSSALNHLASPEHLSFHLKDFFNLTPKNKRRTSGVDGISLDQIGRKNTDFVRDLSTNLRNIKTSKRNRYQHQPLSVFPIEKPSSDKFRIIAIPTVRDRLVQKSLLSLLKYRKLTFQTPISYGGSAEKSVNRAVQNSLSLRNKRGWVYKTDISSFFDRIPRNEMKDLVRKKIRLPSLHEVIFQAIDAEITTHTSDEEERILTSNGIVRGIGLRQGLPISPLLANLYLQNFDKQVESNGYKAIRYVDDLAFFCTSREECLDVHKFCIESLAKIGLEVPPLGDGSKSVIYSPEENAEFLGLMIVKTLEGYELKISDSQISRTYEKFKNYCDINLNIDSGIQFSRLTAKLDSIVSSYKGHYSEASNYNWFEAKLHGWRSHVYRKLISEGLGVNVEELDFKTKLFFHLVNDINLKP